MTKVGQPLFASMGFFTELGAGQQPSGRAVNSHSQRVTQSLRVGWRSMPKQGAGTKTSNSLIPLPSGRKVKQELARLNPPNLSFLGLHEGIG